MVSQLIRSNIIHGNIRARLHLFIAMLAISQRPCPPVLPVAQAGLKQYAPRELTDVSHQQSFLATFMTFKHSKNYIVTRSGHLI